MEKGRNWNEGSKEVVLQGGGKKKEREAILLFYLTHLIWKLKTIVVSVKNKTKTKQKERNSNLSQKGIFSSSEVN